ncbi:hypothetical protein SADUNF_Sadunf16G0016100 [Salix dunnii]|uniref:Uncharacterized protein n=1 Tax=Salix dunnii TaxID=1413687 RepID=A0A835J6L6_9ROSI|nr:hypothetical protein SADUNF_Sadunf16G0016100 [Salix dunnii]
MKVKVANGQMVECESRTTVVPLHMQGHGYAIDFFILTIGHGVVSLVVSSSQRQQALCQISRIKDKAAGY